MDLSGLSAVSTGFQQGTGRELSNDEARQRVEQAKIATKAQQDDQAALAILGRALGVAPPDQPPMQGPGQASQAAPPPPQPMAPPSAIQTSGGQPIAPPGTYMNPAQGPGPQAGPPQRQGPPQPQRQGPPGPPPQGALPQQGAPPPPPPGTVPQAAPPPQASQGQPASQGAPPRAAAPPPGPIVPGQTSLQDLTQRIIRANPGIQSRPDLLVRAIDKGQKLLAPDEKILFDQQKIQLDYSTKIQAIDQRAKAAETKADNAIDLANIRVAQAQATAQAATDRVKMLEDMRDTQADKNNAAKGDQKASATTAKNRSDLMKDARKTGVEVTPEMTDDQIQNLVAVKNAESNGSAVPPSAAKFFGQALADGDYALVQKGLPYGKNKQVVMSQFIAAAQEADPSFDAKKVTSAMAQLGGEKAAVTQTAKTAGNVALGANEIAQTLPLATAAAKKLDLTQFPTVNALKNASARGGLDKDKQAALGQLDQYQQAVQNAYRLVIGRGGRSTVFDAKQAAELMNSNLPVPVLIAKGQAMLKEAAATKKAAGQTIGELTGEGGAQLPAAAKAQLKEGAVTTFGNGQKWTLQDGQPKQITSP